MQQNMGSQGNQMAQVEIQQCISDLMNCYNVCTQTAKNCDQAGGEHGKSEHIWELLDCADICQTAAHFMQHNNPLYGYVVQACAQVTTHCGEHCSQMGDTDCANACQNAAWSCQQVAKMVAE